MESTKPKGLPFPFLRNSSGRADGMWTLCVGATAVAFAGMLLGGSELAWRGLHLKIPVADSTAVVGVLTFVGGYVMRRRDAAREQK